MKELHITRDAEADIQEIWVYLCDFSVDIADRLVDEISAKYETIREFPMMGRQRNELGVNHRSLPVGSYLIVYQVTEARIYILRVVHGSRDLSGVFPQGN